MSSKVDANRRDLAWVVTIILGLAIGFFIKRVHIGLLIGVVLGFVVFALRPKGDQK